MMLLILLLVPCLARYFYLNIVRSDSKSEHKWTINLGLAQGQILCASAKIKEIGQGLDITESGGAKISLI